MFKWLKKKNNINAETYFPSVKELPTISKEKCLKEILKAHKRHQTNCHISGTIDDNLKKFLENKGYTVRCIVSQNNYKYIEIDIC